MAQSQSSLATGEEGNGEQNAEDDRHLFIQWRQLFLRPTLSIDVRLLDLLRALSTPWPPTGTIGRSKWLRWLESLHSTLADFHRWPTETERAIRPDH